MVALLGRAATPVKKQGPKHTQLYHRTLAGATREDVGVPDDAVSVLKNGNPGGATTFSWELGLARQGATRFSWEIGSDQTGGHRPRAFIRMTPLSVALITPCIQLARYLRLYLSAYWLPCHAPLVCHDLRYTGTWAEKQRFLQQLPQ